MPAARIDAFKVSVSNLEGRKLQLRSEAAKRAQRKDDRDCTCTAHPEGSGVCVCHGQPDTPEGLGWP